MKMRLIIAMFGMCLATSAQAAERDYLLGSFKELIVQGDITVILETGKSPSAKATGDKEQLAALKIDRQGQIVRVSRLGSVSNSRSVAPTIVTITGRNINKLVVQGNGKIAASMVDTQQIRTEIRGAGEIDISQIKSDRLIALIVGNGKFSIGSGTVRNAEIIIDGSPIIAAPKMETDRLRLFQNGPATTHFLVKTSAEITNSGTGSITIDGKGACFIKKAGGANIMCASKIGK
jgi:Putative auto-transporter adhesin, head GIN domain